MGTYIVSYLFKFSENESFQYNVEIDELTLQHVVPSRADKPKWSSLDFHSCDHCPLKKEKESHCPIAVSLNDLVQSFGEVKSYQKVSVVVQTRERTYFKDTDVQTGLYSIFGLIMASSACPSMKFLRPLVKFHLPFATTEETLFRIVSMYFLKSYFSKNKHTDFDSILKELKERYQLLGEVNKGLLERITQIVNGDADKNAIVGLDLFVKMFTAEYEDRLDSLAYLFAD